jgi:hypothetical protein
MARQPKLQLVETLDAEPELHIAAAARSPSAPEDTPPPAMDLSSRPRLWFVSGAGRTGKTMLLRYVAERSINQGSTAILGCADPVNRSLKSYFPDVAEPPGNDSASTAKWLEALIGHVLREKISGMVDLGGGDTALHRLASTIPDLLATIDAGGVSPVAVYTLSTRTDDLATVGTFERIGFQPAATALVLNCGMADPTVDRETAFARVRRHSVYRAAIERGAVEVWMPWMDRSVAEAIENKGVSFTAARDAISPPDRKVAPMGLFDRARVRLWLDAMDRALAPLATWIP